MTIMTICFSLVIIRFVEELLRVCLSWLRKKAFQPKVYTYTRISAIVTPELHAKIKAHVTLLNTTITAYVLMAITEKLKRENHG